MPGERRGTMDADSIMGGALLAEAGAPGGSSFGQLVSAFQEVAAGVEGTHRALIERVEHLTRELESMRSRNAEPIACDGEVTLRRWSVGRWLPLWRALVGTAIVPPARSELGFEPLE